MLQIKTLFKFKAFLNTVNKTDSILYQDILRNFEQSKIVIYIKAYIDKLYETDSATCLYTSKEKDSALHQDMHPHFE